MQNIGGSGLSSADAELMLAMSRQYGSLPLMGCWPPLSSSSGVIDSSNAVEAQMKVLELAQHCDQPPPAHSSSFNRPLGINSAGHHLPDAYVQAAMLARYQFVHLDLVHM